MQASSIPNTKPRASDIQDSGTLAVSSISVDHLAEKTAAHSIIAANPIIGNAPTLTLTGALDMNSNRFVRLPAAIITRAAGNTVARAGTTAYLNNLLTEVTLAPECTYTVPANVFPNRPARIKASGNNTSPQTMFVTLKKNGATIDAEYGPLTGPWTLDKDVTLTTGDVFELYYRHSVANNSSCGAKVDVAIGDTISTCLGWDVL